MEKVLITVNGEPYPVAATPEFVALSKTKMFRKAMLAMSLIDPAEFKDRTLVGIMEEYANMCGNTIPAEEGFVDAAFLWGDSPSGALFWGRVDILYRRSLRCLNSMEDEAGH